MNFYTLTELSHKWSGKPENDILHIVASGILPMYIRYQGLVASPTVFCSCLSDHMGEIDPTLAIDLILRGMAEVSVLKDVKYGYVFPIKEKLFITSEEFENYIKHKELTNVEHSLDNKLVEVESGVLGTISVTHKMLTDMLGDCIGISISKKDIFFLEEKIVLFENEHPGLILANDVLPPQSHEKNFAVSEGRSTPRNPPGSRLLEGWADIAAYWVRSISTVKRYSKSNSKKADWIFRAGNGRPLTSTYEIDEWRKITSKK